VKKPVSQTEATNNQSARAWKELARAENNYRKAAELVAFDVARALE
jgi:hypothetical protein